MTHTAEAFLYRGEDEMPVTIEIQWSYDEGVYLERGHPRNGYGKGWICDALKATDAAGEPVTLTEKEKDGFMEDFHPTN